jgi:hypothetical protein
MPPRTQERLQHAAVDIISRQLSAAQAVYKGQLPKDPKDFIVRPFEVQTPRRDRPLSKLVSHNSLIGKENRGKIKYIPAPLVMAWSACLLAAY